MLLTENSVLVLVKQLSGPRFRMQNLFSHIFFGTLAPFSLSLCCSFLGTFALVLWPLSDLFYAFSLFSYYFGCFGPFLILFLCFHFFQSLHFLLIWPNSFHFLSKFFLFGCHIFTLAPNFYYLAQACQAPKPRSDRPLQACHK